jgi:MFS family permease
MSASGSLFGWRPFRLLFTTRVASNAANQMQAVAIGWQIYDLTGSALALGMIGLVQFVPPLTMTLLAGQVVDHYDRRLVLRCCYCVEAAVSVSLFFLSLSAHPSVPAIFVLLLVNGMARSFEGPCLQSLLPAMAPSDMLGAAVAAHASASKVSQLAGPSLGGLLYVFGPSADYGTCAALVFCAGVASYLLPPAPRSPSRSKTSWSTVTAGLRVIWATPILLAAMSLDLIATLFGGVVALLPIFARDLLHIGPWGFGLLRSAPAVGALLVAAACSRFPVRRSGAKFLFSGLMVYGLATFAFGVSRNVFLSLAALFCVGAGDMLSTVVRQTLIQTRTPDDKRGRVFAVSSLFVGTGSQLGMFESGVTADWFGAVGSVVLGAVAVLVAAALWAVIFPDLRRIDEIDRPQSDAESSPTPAVGEETPAGAQ